MAKCNNEECGRIREILRSLLEWHMHGLSWADSEGALDAGVFMGHQELCEEAMPLLGGE